MMSRNLISMSRRARASPLSLHPAVSRLSDVVRSRNASSLEIILIAGALKFDQSFSH